MDSPAEAAGAGAVLLCSSYVALEAPPVAGEVEAVRDRSAVAAAVVAGLPPAAVGELRGAEGGAEGLPLRIRIQTPLRRTWPGLSRVLGAPPAVDWLGGKDGWH